MVLAISEVSGLFDLKENHRCTEHLTPWCVGNKVPEAIEAAEERLKALSKATIREVESKEKPLLQVHPTREVA